MRARIITSLQKLGKGFNAGASIGRMMPSGAGNGVRCV